MLLPDNDRPSIQASAGSTVTAAATCPASRADSMFSYSSSPTRRVLITGGSGFLGFRLATTLAQEGVQAVLLDVAPPRQPLPPGVQFVAGSVADAAAVDAAICAPLTAGNGLETSFASADGPASAHSLDVGPSKANGTGHSNGTRTRASVDAVFHVASFGMSGRELRDRSRIEAVNVGGTRNVVEACLRWGVPRLVYVSTCNVIFVGRTISGGDETAPYPHPSAYKDHYSATKARAERLVVEANGRPLQPQAGFHEQPGKAQAGQGRQLQEEDRDERPAGRRLATCCLRSTGIWGPGETRHQPRVIRMVRAGLFLATFGDRNSITDWIHVDNLVQMLILAERALRAPDPKVSGPGRAETDGPQSAGAQSATNCSTGYAGASVATPNVTAATAATARAAAQTSGVPVAAGQVYYAADGVPLNNFDHFKPFIVGLGYSWPRLHLPFSVMYGIAALIEFTWPLLQYFVNDPLLIRMEIDKSCIEHWFDISKARRELGYVPKVYNRQDVVDHMAAEGWSAAAVAPGQRHQWHRQLRVVLLVAALAVLVGVGLWYQGVGRYGGGTIGWAEGR